MLLFLIIYISLFIMLSVRMFKLKNFSRREKTGRFFYRSLFSVILLRIIGIFIILFIFSSLSFQESYIILELPTALSLIPFAVLGIIKLDKTYQGHMNSHLGKTIITNASKTDRFKSIKPILYCFLPLLLSFL